MTKSLVDLAHRPLSDLPSKNKEIMVEKLTSKSLGALIFPHVRRWRRTQSVVTRHTSHSTRYTETAYFDYRGVQ